MGRARHSPPLPSFPPGSPRGASPRAGLPKGQGAAWRPPASTGRFGAGRRRVTVLGCRAGISDVGRTGARTHRGGGRAPQSSHWLCLAPRTSPRVSPAHSDSQDTAGGVGPGYAFGGGQGAQDALPAGWPGWGCRVGAWASSRGARQHRSTLGYSGEGPGLHLTPHPSACRAPRAGCRQVQDVAPGRAVLGVPRVGGRWPAGPGRAAVCIHASMNFSATRCLRAAARCKFLRGGGSIFVFP